MGPAILSTIERLSSSLCTVEPLNKGHIGTSHKFLSTIASFWRSKNVLLLWGNCPFQEGYMSSSQRVLYQRFYCIGCTPQKRLAISYLRSSISQAHSILLRFLCLHHLVSTTTEAELDLLQNEFISCDMEYKDCHSL